MANKIGAVQNGILEDVITGLNRPQKELPSKYFYDKRGSKLFEQITRLPEYYPAHCEKQILQQYIGEIADYIASDTVIVELGSGSSSKTRLLLDHIPELAGYIPVDISKQYLTMVEQQLRDEYPNIFVDAVCADYTKPFQLAKNEHNFRYYLFFYPGSTIGNFLLNQARNFLQRISEFMVPGGGLIIGVDLEKDSKKIEPAYNDSQGITAAFNKNLLVRLNRELDTDFNIHNFRHKAYYNTSKSRIEMHLVSMKEQFVQLDGQKIRFKKGETIHTENSHKYSLSKFESLVSKWFRVEKIWTDKDELYSVQYLVKKRTKL